MNLDHVKVTMTVNNTSGNHVLINIGIIKRNLDVNPLFVLIIY